MKKGIRKMLSAIACAALAMGCLAGCGSNTNSSAANTTTESAAENTSTAAAEASDSTQPTAKSIRLVSASSSSTMHWTELHRDSKMHW
ncbi:MAG: hypothetical protein ACLUI7_07875 [Coprococcus sp.]